MIIEFPGKYYGEARADDVLRAIAEQNPSKVFVVVWPEDGGRPTYHSNTADVPVIVLRLQQFLHKLFRGDFTDGDEI